MLQKAEFETLFKKHYSSLHRVSLNILRDGDAAHDAVQEVFTRLWHHRSSLLFSAPAEVYLRKAVINTSLNFIKRTHRHVNLDDHYEIPYREANPPNDVEFRKALEKGLATLTPKCKTIFILSRIEGLDNQEIADFLDISRKTVENQLSIALKQLKNYFEEQRSQNPDLFRMFMITFF